MTDVINYKHVTVDDKRRVLLRNIVEVSDSDLMFFSFLKLDCPSQQQLWQHG